MTDILSRQKYNKEDMNCAIEALRKGSIVLFPTELGWVLGCDLVIVLRLKNFQL
jgi:tRNA A37 threonylcarbamoyladenosine synthetase subunit TsaC/SUA5/YrdC